MAEQTPSPRLLVLGAHPDDAEIKAGGLAEIYRKLGRDVKLVSVTRGDAGHHRLPREQLTRIRREEAAAAAAVIGAESDVWDFPDGALLPTLELRERVIREIRCWRPDLVLTHRVSDYHPDHRAIGQAVQDASYMVTVPLVVPDTPALRRDPVVAQLRDDFTRPCPFRADVVIDVGPQVDTIVAMLACHASQVFDWLPYNRRMEAEVPGDATERRAWLRRQYADRQKGVADRFREQLRAAYGAEHAAGVELVEAFEISEYAAAPSTDEVARLFPTTKS
ncbi:MAG: PIG-L family deacetylase [Pirellulaceae bacterium]